MSDALLQRRGGRRLRRRPVSDDLSRLDFTLENRTGGAHRTGLSVAGLPADEYAVAVDGRAVATIRGTDEAQVVELPIGPAASSRVTISRAGCEGM